MDRAPSWDVVPKAERFPAARAAGKRDLENGAALMAAPFFVWRIGAVPPLVFVA
jgi:hypothetical protein